jgi:glycosyltransferase involved in cell wall biosynthesis
MRSVSTSPLSAAPLVSVIVPAYNAGRYITDSLRSVVDQDYRPIEILLVDDGSTDDTIALALETCPDLRLFRQPNAGAGAARNVGLENARGELIAFLDADDGWFAGKLATQVRYLREHPSVGLVYHSWYVWKPDTTGAYQAISYRSPPVPREADPARSGWIYPELLLDCIVHTCSAMIRREVVHAVGFFDTTLSHGEDYDYWLRVSRRCEMHKLTGVYSFYREVPSSLTNSTPKPENYEYRVISNAMRRWGLTGPDGRGITAARARKRLADLAFGFGYAHFRRGSPRLAARAFLRALSHQPWRWRAAALLLISIAKPWLPGDRAADGA